MLLNKETIAGLKMYNEISKQFGCDSRVKFGGKSAGEFSCEDEVSAVIIQGCAPPVISWFINHSK
jgi:hypothetical protein